MAKIGWKCIITGCTSSAKAPAHFFPKNKELMEKWLKAVSQSWMSSLSENKIRKCRICHLHFDENAYIFTLNRRRLKHNAIPTLNLAIEMTEENDILQPSINQVQEKHTFDNMQHNDVIERIENNFSEPSTSQEKDTVLETNIKIDIFEQKTQQQINSEISLNTPKRFNRINHSRNILGDITREKHLTPIARKLYVKCRTFQKQNNILRRNLVHYKHRLKYATKFSSLTFFKKYSALTNTQRMFIEMQIKNLNKKSKVNFSAFCTKIKSALKNICNDKHASIFLENIGINSS